MKISISIVQTYRDLFIFYQSERENVLRKIHSQQFVFRKIPYSYLADRQQFWYLKDWKYVLSERTMYPHTFEQ